MSIPVSNLVWEFSGHKSGNLLVLLAIADHADDRGEAWPGIPRLALKSRLSERHVRRCLKTLESSLELAILPNGSRCGGPLYRICLERLKRNAETPTTAEMTPASSGEDVNVIPSSQKRSGSCGRGDLVARMWLAVGPIHIADRSPNGSRP